MRFPFPYMYFQIQEEDNFVIASVDNCPKYLISNMNYPITSIHSIAFFSSHPG